MSEVRTASNSKSLTPQCLRRHLPTLVVDTNVVASFDDIMMLDDDLSRSTTLTYNMGNLVASATEYNSAVNYTYNEWARSKWLQRTIGGNTEYMYLNCGIDGKLIRTDGRLWTGFAKQVSDGYAGDSTRSSRFVWDSNIFSGDTTNCYYAATSALRHLVAMGTMSGVTALGRA